MVTPIGIEAPAPVTGTQLPVTGASSSQLLLVTGSETASQQVYEALLAKARSGDITAANLQTSYTRIMALKARL